MEWWVILLIVLVALFAVLETARAISFLRWARIATHTCGPAKFAPQKEKLHGRYFQSKVNGLWIYHRSWTVPGATASCLLLHGFAEHSGRYEHVAAILNSAGVDVHALDHQGHGQSEGDRAYFERFDHMVEDVVQFTTEVKRVAIGKKPLFLFGHSMGGLLGLHVAAHPVMKDKFVGVIISGPALLVDPALDTPLNRTVGGLLSSILPKVTVQALDSGKVCKDTEVVAQYRRDPLNYTGAVRARVGMEMLAAASRAKDFAADLKVPIFIQHGAADMICPLAGSQRYMDLMTASTDKTLQVYDELFHEILNEQSFTAVLNDTVQWLKKHVPAGGEVQSPVTITAGGASSSSS